MTTACEQWIERLAEAEVALHKLAIGSKVEVLRAGEKQLTYTKAELGELRKYVDSLQAKVDACNGTRSSKKRIVQFIPE
jgi:peptidoglycan hydrolase CwlO-like protein